MARKSAAVDVMDVLAGAETKGDKKSDVIQYPNRVPKVSELVDADKQLSELEAKIKILQDEVKTLVEPFYFEQVAKKYEPSMKVPGLDGDSLLIIHQARWTKIGIELKEQLVDIAKDLYEDLFKTKIKIEVKDTTDENLLRSLIEKVGKDEFAKFFAVSRQIVPTEKYLKQRKELLSKDQQDKLGQLVRQVVSFRVSEE